MARRVLRLAVAVAATGLAIGSAAGQTPYGSCGETAQSYQDRYESSGQVSDMVCMQKALEREMLQGPPYSCDESAQSYQNRYQSTGRVSDLVCVQESLKRELQ